MTIAFQIGNEIPLAQNSSYKTLLGLRITDDGASGSNLQLARYTTAGVFIENALTVVGATGSIRLAGGAANYSTASQSGFATDTYVLNSNVAVRAGVGLVAGTRYRCTFSVTKTAAGTAAATFAVRIGTAGAVADTARLTFTADVAQTAAIASGIITVEVLVRSQSATGVIAGGVGVATSSVGLGGGATGVSSTFDNTFATLGATNSIGLSVNGGASAAWTINHVVAELIAP